MKPYMIYTDSSCDISPSLLAEWGVGSESLSFHFTDDGAEHLDTDVPAAEFYAGMRAGRQAKTAAVNVDAFKTGFERVLQQGFDLLYLGFSSGLSSTFNSGRLAMEELQAKYPERQMIAVDTLSASAGFGLLVYLAVQKKNNGASLEETAQFIRDTRLHLCHWFTVDDLRYLRAGGRISSAAALLGSVLSIKPVLHMDNEGHLINVSKVRGRRAAIRALAAKVQELSSDPDAPIFISHGDCLDDAETLKAILETEQHRHVDRIADVGPVIGAHSGPGTLSVFFLGRER